MSLNVRSLPRTAVPVWSPASLPRPLLATGTISGALDASFSSDSTLELWDPFSDATHGNGPEQQPIASINVSSRFNKLAWGYVKQPERPRGVIAAGFENGEICLFDPHAILEPGKANPLIVSYDLHKGPVRGLDFNSHQPNLIASGATNGEVYVWDLLTPNKPFSPGARSRSLDNITSVAWNNHVAHILATSSDSGYTVVWDLKGKREVTALSYAGNAPTGVGANFGQPGWSTGGKRGVSAVQWHPDNPTKLVTATDDDHNPVILLWDLRNWKEPERIMTGHEKGVLSLSWCQRDSDLLLSSGKDGRTIAWSPLTGEIVAEVTPSSNWTFDAQWCPRNPSMISTASLEGKIEVRSIQSTAPVQAPDLSSNTALAPGQDGANIFEAAISANAANYPTKSLTHAPKWLKRPSSVAFGFGGKLVTISHNSQEGSVVNVRSFVSQPEIVERALRLEHATESQNLADFCEAKREEVERSDLKADVKNGESASWKLLATMFDASESRSQLIQMLGFSAEDIKRRVDDATKPYREKLAKTDPQAVVREPTVTFANSTPTDGRSASSEGEGAATVSVSGVSDATNKFPASEADSELTEPSLFDDETHQVLTPNAQSQAAADFYSQIGSGRPAALPDHVFDRAGANSSVAATIGSASSVASVNVKASSFRVFAESGSETDRLITEGLIVGDFASAVEVALSVDRFADALLIASQGGPDLVSKTQKAYFKRQADSMPYLRVLQSVVAGDLTDVVQNADLADWPQVFVTLCTFARAEDFPSLAEQLGQRLEYKHKVVSDSPSPEQAPELRKNAILCYLAAGKLEKVVTIWLQQMKEDEAASKARSRRMSGLSRRDISSTAVFEAHARALQTFIEKVTVFQNATAYVDQELTNPPNPVDGLQTRPYKLGALYERYAEYAELLATQGLVTVALRYTSQIPEDFRALDASSQSFTYTRERLAKAAGQYYGSSPRYSSNYQITGQAQQTNSGYGSQSAYGATSSYGQPAYGSQSAYGSTGYGATSQYGASTSVNNDPYGYSASNAYGSRAPPVSNNAYGAASQPSAYAPQYGQQSAPAPVSSYSQQQQQPTEAQYQPQSFIPAPPPVIQDTAPMQNNMRGNTSPANMPPPPPRKAEGAWNDAPLVQSSRKSTPAGPAKPNAITSPFPNAPSSGMSPQMPSSGFPAAAGNNPNVPPPPPSRTGNRTPAQVVPPPPTRGSAPAPAAAAPPPPRAGQGYAPHQPQQHQQQPQPSGPYAPAPQQQPNSGPYGQPARGPAGQQPPQQQQPSIQPMAQRAEPGPYDPPAMPQGPPRGSAGPSSGPYPPQPQQQNSGPYGPPPPSSQGPYGAAPPPPGAGVRPPPGGPLNGQVGPGRTASPAPPRQAPRPEPPKPKYPPGDRTHIPEAHKPIVAILTNEIKRLKQITPPQQAKIVADTEKRLNVLFDMLNCETISPATAKRVLDICRAIESRNQAGALDQHLQMITAGVTDAGAFQAALKFVIQRMAH